MTTDFRALCAELLAWADKASAHYYQSPDVLVRARAALAEPQPAADGEVVATGKPGLHVEPIPVSERLPEAGDCDAKGRCWFGQPLYSEETRSDWFFTSLKHGSCFICWLPASAATLPAYAHALPLPSGEGE